MTLTGNPSTTTAPATAPARRAGRWIDDGRPEDPTFWENGGKQVARRNLAWSIFAEHLGFSVWLICGRRGSRSSAGSAGRRGRRGPGWS